LIGLVRFQRGGHGRHRLFAIDGDVAWLLALQEFLEQQAAGEIILYNQCVHGVGPFAGKIHSDCERHKIRESLRVIRVFRSSPWQSQLQKAIDLPSRTPVAQGPISFLHASCWQTGLQPFGSA
jgi:hypothetical protein